MSEDNWTRFEPRAMLSIVRRLHLCESTYDPDGWHDGYSADVKVADRNFFVKEYTYSLRMSGGEVTLVVDHNTSDNSGDDYLIVRIDTKGGVTLKTDDDICEFFWPDPCSDMIRDEAFRKWYRTIR